MLSYEKCLELKNAGFPQPEIKIGGAWYLKSKYATEEGVFLCSLVTYSNLPEPFTIGIAMIEGEKKMVEVPGPDYLAYCPSVEDMLSLLAPQYSIRRSGGRNKWLLMETETVHPVYMRENLLEMLADAFLGKSASLIFDKP